LTSPRDTTFELLRDYIAALQTRRLASKTVCDRVIILKRFFGYLAAEGRLTQDPAQRLPLPKVGRRLPKALTLEEMQAFLLALSIESALGHRDRVLFELMYAGGLRVSEALSLHTRDIDFADGSIRVIGKGDKERRIYLKPPLMGLLREYMAQQHLSGVLFPSPEGKPLTARNIELRIKLYAKAAGIERRVTPHTLRHSIAVHYLQGGAPVNFVQGLLGHASLATTGRYLQLTDQMAKQIAMQTKTALDQEPGPDKELKGRDGRWVYTASTDPGWDLSVDLVMEWLAAS
jgi:integrase/recombinase XerD